MRRTRAALRRVTLLLALWPVLQAHAAAPQAGSETSQRFESANAAFAAGRYAEAREGFAQVLREDGASASVLFNLGNASFRAGRVADAILSYERALLLAPRDQDVRANLRRAREAAELPADDGGAWGRLVALATLDGWAFLASGGLWLLCGALIALRLVRADSGAV
ncbi:MAG: tetratricopeptide repeat protein, partial [Thermodesulfobacteriota bacterium]